MTVRILDYIEGSRRVLRVISGGAVCRGVESGCARLEQQRRGRRPGVVVSRGSLGGGFRILDYIEGARRVLRGVSGGKGAEHLGDRPLRFAAFRLRSRCGGSKPAYAIA